jgi:hypothetical protein
MFHQKAYQGIKLIVISSEKASTTESRFAMPFGFTAYKFFDSERLASAGL